MKSNKTYEGFETFSNAFYMSIKMHCIIFMGVTVVYTMLLLIIIHKTQSYNTYVTTRFFFASQLSALSNNFTIQFRNPNGNIINVSPDKIISNQKCIEIKNIELMRWKQTGILLLPVYLLHFLLIYLFNLKSKKQTNREYIRGARLTTVKQFFKETSEKKIELDLPTGQVKMPIDSEPRHCLTIGRPGSGKTVCMSAWLERLIERNSKMVIYDNKGDFLSRFYDDETDIIFNPLEVRSVNWNIFDELESTTDIDAVSASLIPIGGSKDPFWTDAARMVLNGIISHLYYNHRRSNEDIWKMIISDGSKIAEKLKATSGGQAGHKFIEKPDSNQSLGIFATLMQYTKCFEFMQDDYNNKNNFSIKKWLKNKGGRIYITNYADVKDTLRPILSLFIDMISRGVLSLPDSRDRRVYFFLDEFGTLQRLSSILNLLTLARSKGGCVFIGIQDYGQIDKLYTKEYRQSITNACGNKIYFGMSDDAAKITSDGIGDIEINEYARSYSIGVQSLRDGINLSQNKKKEPLILASDITALPDLNAIVKFPNYDYIKSKWTYKHYDTKNIPIILRKDLSLSKTYEEQQDRIEELRTKKLDVNFQL